MIKVLIVDDQIPVQDFLIASLEKESGLEIVGTANNGKIAIQQVAALRPDIVLMDIDMPEIDGLTATKIIAERFIETKVLILTIYEDDTYLNKALQVGAKGYLLKTTAATELINAIYSACKNYFQLGPGLLEKYLYKFAEAQSNLTEVEHFKEMLEKQYQLLEKIQEKEDVIEPDRELDKTREPGKQTDILLESYSVLKNQIDLLQFRQEKLIQQLSFLQTFCIFLFLTLAIALLGIFMIIL
ncbi:MAG: response regulator transcription factor [Hydrococcus sp. RU_2_2]|nr:response regulator transcription factor [Hydrococcus sp. RU_2_2]NJP19235.1 response regulator transcription factor [Hydrococcus sp. CRU_1_1]